jgi:hypothetical protein
MKSKTMVVLGVVCALIATSQVVATSAQAVDVAGPAGWTESEFVAAAASEGISAQRARDAWSDPDSDRLAQIPVSSHLESSQPAAEPTAGAASYSAWCAYTKTNVFGQTLARFTVSSSWSAEGAGITNVDTAIATEVGWGWAFQGLSYTHDAYGTAYENPRGAHTADRWANFSWGSDGDAATLKVSIVSLALGSHNCSSQEN